MSATRKKAEPLPDLPRRLVAVPPPDLAPVPSAPLPGRVNVNIGEPPPNNVVQFPTRNPAAIAPPAEVPLELPTYTRPRIVQPAPTNDSGAVVAPAIGEPDMPTRPRRVYGPGTLEHDTQLLKDLQALPPEKMSRKRAALVGFLQGVAQGAQGGLGGIIGGGLTGLGVGLAAPGAVARMKRKQDIAETEQRLHGEYGRAKVASDLKNEEVKRNLETAQAIKALKDPAYKPDVTTDNNGNLISVVGGVATPVLDKQGNPVKAKVTTKNATREWRNDPNTGKAELWEMTPGQPASKVEGAVNAKLDLVKTPRGWVSPGTALTADATADGTRYRRIRDTQGDEQHDTERTEDVQRRTAEQDRTYRKEAAEIAGKVAEFNAEAGKWKGLAERTADKELKAYYEGLADEAKQKGNAKALELSQGYGDIYEAGPGDDGWAYVKPKGTTPAELPTRVIRKGKGGVRPKVSAQKLAGLLGVQ